MVKINKSLTVLLLSVLVAGSSLMTSCDEWLDIKSHGEVLEEDAFKEIGGFRSALIGVYELAASPDLWGQELTWGYLSTLSRNYGTAIPSLNPILSYNNFDNTYAQAVHEKIWKQAYKAIANLNNIIQNLEKTDLKFEYPWEKDMIMAEARGLRALIHFEMLQLFAPAPASKEFSGSSIAIPYVKDYPNKSPQHLSFDEVIKNVLEDLIYAQQTLEPIDIDLRETSHYDTGTTVKDNMNYVLFQGYGNMRSDGGARNGIGDGFFAFRGFRFNYWGASALLARVYSYLRDFGNAEKYADVVMSWVRENQFEFYNTNPSHLQNPNAIDFKRRPEPLIAFYNADLATDYYSLVTSSYNKMVGASTTESSNKFKNLFDDPTADVRYVDLFDNTFCQYRGWAIENRSNVIYEPGPAVSENAQYSSPLVPVLELPEVYFIKAECQARNGDIPGALATVKCVRDARGCVALQSASSLDEFMNLLVMEAQRDFLTRGTTYTFLKKLDWPAFFDATTTGFLVYEKFTGETGSYYVLPIPDSETRFY